MHTIVFILVVQYSSQNLFSVARETTHISSSQAMFLTEAILPRPLQRIGGLWSRFHRLLRGRLSNVITDHTNDQ